MAKSPLKLIIALAAFALAIAPAALVSAQQATQAAPKIAVLNMQLILRDSTAMKGVRVAVETERKKFQTEIGNEEKRLRAEGQKLARQRGVLSPQAEARKRRQLQIEIARVQRTFQARRRAIDQAFSTTLRDFQKQLRQVVAEVAKEKGYTLVITRRQLAYHAPGMSITGEVLKRLNKRLPILNLRRVGAAATPKVPAKKPKATK